MNTLITMSLRHPAPTPVEAHLEYDENAPYIVRITFSLGPQTTPVVWELGRDLIRDGLVRPTGDGDVALRPADPRTVLLFLAADKGAASLSAPRQALHDFLQRTAKAVPYGAEGAVPTVRASLDRELQRILNEAC